MDYSSIQQDHENPNSSPWASSPKQSRNSLSANPHGDPPTLSPALPQSPFSERPMNQAVDAREHEETMSQAPTVIENGHIEPSSSSLPYRSDGQEIPSQPNTPQSPTQPQQHQQQQSRPQGQARPASRYHGNRPESRQNIPQYKLQPKVTGLERPGRKDPIIGFDIYTNLPGYRTTQFRDVRRTHSEFQKLADHLVSSNPEAFVPAIPPSSTPAGVGTDEDEAKVKASMQRWLSIVCGNEVLMRDEEMVRFIEGDPGYSPVVRRSQPATGVRRKVIKQFAPPPDDTPELQDSRPIVKRFYLGAMDAGQKVDKVVKTRRGLGLAESDFGVKLGALTEQESHPGLKQAFRKLGRTVQTAGDLHASQGTVEATTIGEPLHYHSSDAFIVKETLTNRHILFRELVQAQQSTRSKLSAADRLKASASVRREKVDEAISALDEARSHESYLYHKTQRVTANLLLERRRWFGRTAADLRASIREYVIRQIEAERRALAILEAVRPDIRAIDASGGLSRLGREATPAARRATLQSSQGPKGDAWSGVQRRPDGLNRSISGGFAVPAVPEAVENDASGGSDNGGGRKRTASGSGSLKSVAEEDDDRVDAKNAASRLAASTF